MKSFAAILAVAALVAATPMPANKTLGRRDCATIPSVADNGVLSQVYQVAVSRNVSPKVLLATIETAWIESHVNNLNCGDQDSLGVFQQRPSQGWGSPDQLQDVSYSTNAFLNVCIPNDAANPGYTAGQLAQSVQRSEFPDRYQEAESIAQGLLAQASGGSAPAPSTSGGGGGGGCSQTYTTNPGDYCYAIAQQFGITVDQFLSMNGAVNSACTNLQVGVAYCV